MLRACAALALLATVAAQGRRPNRALRADPRAFGLAEAAPFDGELPASWSIRDVGGCLGSHCTRNTNGSIEGPKTRCARRIVCAD